MRYQNRWQLHSGNLLLFIIFLLPFFPAGVKLGPTGLNRYLVIVISCCVILLNGPRFCMLKTLSFIYLFAGIMLLPLVINWDVNYIIFLFTDILLPLYIGFALIDTDKKLCQLIKVLIISGTILGLTGIFEAFTGINLIDRIFGFETIRYAANAYRMGIARTYTSFGTSINFCLYLNILQVLCLYMVFARKKNLYYVPYGILLLASVLTISRGPIVINMIMQLYILKKSGFFHRYSFYYVACFGSFLILFLIWFLNIDVPGLVNGLVASIGVLFNKEKYETVADQWGMGGSNERVQLFLWIYESVKNRIIAGNGYAKGFMVKVNQWKIKTSIENYYLAIFNSCGLLGLMAIFSLFSGLLKKLWPAAIWKYNYTDQISFTFYAFSAAVLFFTTILTVSIQDEGRVFFLIMGAALAYKWKGLEVV